MVLCCICGVDIVGIGHAGRCAQCLQKEVDITQGISRKVHIQHCSTCGRWLKPGTGQYAVAELESRELLSVCLKSIRGITKERSLVDAGFLWTEPHSKELKVKLTLQQEAWPGIVVQQNVTVEFRIDNLQCGDCKKTFTRHTWESSVQVRQRASHRRTLLHLEQLILQHKAHTRLIKVQATKEGMDFFFTKERDAQDFSSFVRGVAVTRHHESKHLVSANLTNNTQRFKRTTCIEICPVCRDDLAFFPPKLAKEMGGLPPYMICTRAASVIGLTDPFSGRKLEMAGVEYFKRQFQPAFSINQLTEFVVLDITPLDFATHGGGGKIVPLYEAEIARVADFGKNDDRMVTRTHIGHLQVGDHALGYDLRTLNSPLDELDWEKVPQEVYLIKRHQPDKVKKRKNGYRGKKPKAQAKRFAKEIDARREDAEAEALAEAGAEADRADAAATAAAAAGGGGDGGADAEQCQSTVAEPSEEEADEGGDDDEDEDEDEIEAAAAQMLDALGTNAAEEPEEGDVPEDRSPEDAAEAPIASGPNGEPPSATAAPVAPQAASAAAPVAAGTTKPVKGAAKTGGYPSGDAGSDDDWDDGKKRKARGSRKR